MHASFANTSVSFSVTIDSLLLFIIEMALIGMINNTCQNDPLEVGQINTPSI